MPRCKMGEDCIGWFCDSRQSWIRCLKRNYGKCRYGDNYQSLLRVQLVDQRIGQKRYFYIKRKNVKNKIKKNYLGMVIFLSKIQQSSFIWPTCEKSGSGSAESF